MRAGIDGGTTRSSNLSLRQSTRGSRTAGTPKLQPRPFTESIIIEIRFHNITVFTVFLINKCSLGEHKRHFSKTLQNLTDPKLLQFADF